MKVKFQKMKSKDSEWWSFILFPLIAFQKKIGEFEFGIGWLFWLLTIEIKKIDEDERNT